MQLKVCERCGVLWCRVVGEEGVHCTKCKRALREQRKESRVELRVGRPAK